MYDFEFRISFLCFCMHSMLRIFYELVNEIVQDTACDNTTVDGWTGDSITQLTFRMEYKYLYRVCKMSNLLLIKDNVQQFVARKNCRAISINRSITLIPCLTVLLFHDNKKWTNLEHLIYRKGIFRSVNLYSNFLSSQCNLKAPIECTINQSNNICILISCRNAQNVFNSLRQYYHHRYILCF